MDVSFGALAPVIMVHGNGQGDDGHGGMFWDGSVLGDQDPATKFWMRLQMPFNVTASFKSAAIPYDNSISMPSDTIAAHGPCWLNWSPPRRPNSARAART